MRAMLKRFAGIVAGVLALSLLASGPANAIPDKPASTLTVAEYTAYLAEEAPDLLAEFEALTPAEQDQYLRLLANPDLYTEKAENLDGVDVGGTSVDQTRASGFRIRSSVTPMASAIDRSVLSTRWVTILGLKVLEYKTEIGYQVARGKVTKINYSSAIVVRNLNPLVKTGQSSKFAWVSPGGASARLKATFHYDIGPIKGLSAQVGTLNATLTGFPGGTSSYQWWGS